MKFFKPKKYTFAVRGAVQLEADTDEDMRRAVCNLVSHIVHANDIDVRQDLISIQFTQTDDIRNANPARELRTDGYDSVPLFCSLEPRYSDWLELTVRVLVLYRAAYGHVPRPVYLGGAANLRNDI